MTFELLTNMYYAAPELWFVLAVIFILVSALGVFYWFNFLRMKQKNYFLNRDRERYAEKKLMTPDTILLSTAPEGLPLCSTLPTEQNLPFLRSWKIFIKRT